MAFFDMFKKLPSQKGIVGINKRNLDLIYTHNKRTYFPNVDNKLLCKKILLEHNIPVPKTLYVVDSPKVLKGWENELSSFDNYVIKPNRGFGGNGIKLITRVEDTFYSSGEELTIDDISFHIQQIYNGAFSIDNTSDTAYFEETITNHPALSQFTLEGQDGITDIRIIYQDNIPVMAMLRAPTKESDGKANLHQGGIGIGIDLQTSMTTNGCHKNNFITHHPDNKIELKGCEVPFFQEMLEFGAKISDIVNLGYIGVDFVCDVVHGAMVLEVNARPGLNIQLANQDGLGTKIQ